MVSAERILIADVKPFHIVVGHISTNLLKENVRLLALRLEGNKYSIPIFIGFHEHPIPGFDEREGEVNENCPKLHQIISKNEWILQLS